MSSLWDSTVEIWWLRDREGKEGRGRGAGGKHENGKHERWKEEKEKEEPAAVTVTVNKSQARVLAVVALETKPEIADFAQDKEEGEEEEA